MIADPVHSSSAILSHDALLADQIGSRLRSLREQRQMSLLDVEQLSGGDIGPSSIGAYERGDRTISLPRLNRLATLYGVPLEHLLPCADKDRSALRPTPITERLIIGTDLLGHLAGEPFLSLLRFIELIREQRADPDRSLITLRGADAVVIAAMLGTTVDQVIDRLTALDLLATEAT